MEDIKATMTLAPDAKKLTPEIFAQAFFGKSFDDLVKAMQENRGGEFDNLYLESERS